MYSFIYWMELHLTLGSSANNASANDAFVDKGKGKGKVVEADDKMEEEEEEEEDEDVSEDEEEEEEDEEVRFFSRAPFRRVKFPLTRPCR
jgi:Ran GTPase-activating protein (RanGAP) involved in mRNA processing and transport